MIGLTKFVESVVINNLAAPASEETTIGSGLRGQYYDDKEFDSLRFIRTDPQVNFDWGRGSPDFRLNSDGFSIKWHGFVNAEISGTYTFFALSDDGIRVTIDGQVVVADFVNHPPRESSGNIFLEEGWHDIFLEYFEDRGVAVIQLSFEGPETEKQIINQASLASPSDTSIDNPLVTGLKGQYYDNSNFTNFRFDRIDENIDFIFRGSGANASIEKLDSGPFSIIWNGFIKVANDELFTFTADIGGSLFNRVELTIDGATVFIGSGNPFGTISLEPGFHNLELKFVANDQNSASLRLLYESDVIDEQVIHTSALFPMITALVLATPTLGGSSLNFGGNEFELFDTAEITTVRVLAAKSNVTTTSHSPFLSPEDSSNLIPISPTATVRRNESVIFVNKNITSMIGECELERRVREVRLQNAGIHGKFPIILPSREKEFTN